jgi:hypothetical protein
LRHDSEGASKNRPSVTSARPTYKKGFTSTPVKGSAAGAALTGTIAGAAAVGAVGAVPDGPGGGVLLAATTGGTVVVDVVVVDVVVVEVVGGGAVVVEVAGGGAVVVVGDVQSSMVCWNPRFATHGGPT